MFKRRKKCPNEIMCESAIKASRHLIALASKYEETVKGEPTYSRFTGEYKDRHLLAVSAKNEIVEVEKELVRTKILYKEQVEAIGKAILTIADCINWL